MSDELTSTADEVSRIALTIQNAENPPDRFRTVMLDIEREEQVQLLIGVFERVHNIDGIENYWALAIAVRGYSALHEHKAAFAIACYARSLEPDGGAGSFLNATLYHHFLASGRLHDAIDICLDNLKRFPSLPFTTEPELNALMESVGLARPAGHADQRLSDFQPERTLVLDASYRDPWVCPMVFGRGVPSAVAYMRDKELRPPIEVVKLTDVEVLIAENQIAIVDKYGNLISKYSVAAFPSEVVRKFNREEKDGEKTAERVIDRAILLSDAWPSPNYCHFLLDQMARRILYRSAIGQLDDVVSIGPELATTWQREIAGKFSVYSYIHTAQFIRVKAAQLWVSSECRNTLHHAYAGSRLITDFIRETFATPTEGVSRRLYVSRNDGPGRRIINEEEILPILESYGFCRIYPGQISVEEQAKLFASATHIVGPHGANMTNIIFANPGTHVMEIFHPLYSNAAFIRLAPVLGLNYSAMTGSDGTSNLPQFNEPSDADAMGFIPSHMRSILVDTSELIRWLEATKCAV